MVGRLYAENAFFKKSIDCIGESDRGRKKRRVVSVKYKPEKESLDSEIRISIQRATQLLGISICGFWFYKWLRQLKT